MQDRPSSSYSKTTSRQTDFTDKQRITFTLREKGKAKENENVKMRDEGETGTGLLQGWRQRENPHLSNVDHDATALAWKGAPQCLSTTDGDPFVDQLAAHFEELTRIPPH